MVRPRRRRKVSGEFCTTYFKPAGIPVRTLQTINLSIDELEAVRLTDFEELYQADAAEKMNVSRQTLGNILKSAHKKIAEALILGKAIRIEGGAIDYIRSHYFCKECENTFAGQEDEQFCPNCNSTKITPLSEQNLPNKEQS